jgi:hypothetical protein
MDGYSINFGGTDDLLVLVVFSVISLSLVAHFLLALGVFADVTQRNTKRLVTRFGGPWTWAIATFLLGLLALGSYWVIHYSTFVRSTPDEEPHIYSSRGRKSSPEPAAWRRPPPPRRSRSAGRLRRRSWVRSCYDVPSMAARSIEDDAGRRRPPGLTKGPGGQGVDPVDPSREPM